MKMSLLQQRLDQVEMGIREIRKYKKSEKRAGFFFHSFS
jgi:hypothetical protein